MNWPDPNASAEDVAAFLQANAPPAAPAHEAPAVENGPSIVCAACGIVRVSLFTPLCKGCLISHQRLVVINGESSVDEVAARVWAAVLPTVESWIAERG